MIYTIVENLNICKFIIISSRAPHIGPPDVLVTKKICSVEFTNCDINKHWYSQLTHLLLVEMCLIVLSHYIHIFINALLWTPYLKRSSSMIGFNVFCCPNLLPVNILWERVLMFSNTGQKQSPEIVGIDVYIDVNIWKHLSIFWPVFIIGTISNLLIYYEHRLELKTVSPSQCPN